MAKTKTTKRLVRFAAATAAAAVAITLAAALVPAGVDGAQAAAPEFVSRLAGAPVVAKIADQGATLELPFAVHQLTVTSVAPVAAQTAAYAPATVAPVTRTVSSTTRTATVRTTTVSAPKPANELATARAILAGYIAKYPILAGSTITFGDARGHQAITYYKSGRIVISPTHTASLQRIIAHEIMHIIDWRDNGVINWGENVPRA